MPFPPPDPDHAAAPELPQADVAAASPMEPVAAARPGDLASAWRWMLGFGWISSFFAYAGVWQASVQIGIGTWWVGPRAQPPHIMIRFIPFYLSLVIGLLIVYNVRWILRWSATGVALAALISIPDFSRSVGLGIAEAVIAGLLGVITLASASGRYRLAQAEPARVAPAPPESAPLDPSSR